MAKRKIGVSRIFLGLENDDIEISSDEEVIEPKINRFNIEDCQNDVHNKLSNDESETEIIKLDCSDDGACEIVDVVNGGKELREDNSLHEPVDNTEIDVVSFDDVDCSKPINHDKTVYDDEIVVDSPTNSDLGVVGCENRTPLVTIRFKNKKLADNYKEKVKIYLQKLIKLDDDDNSVYVESENDIEIDIWPEDLVAEDLKDDLDEDSNTFFIDTAPCEISSNEIPRYTHATSILQPVTDEETSNQTIAIRRGPICFNCEGDHALMNCKEPRDNARIAENRKNKPVKVGRYHVEEEQKSSHLIPGRISRQLRHALGLKHNELPLHIYKMRMLGYPPGWLEDARITHSGITMFDSTGQAIDDPEDEEGMLIEPGSKDKFDIKKILDFPGFNVPYSSRYRDEAQLYGLPPMSEHDSKLAMLQMLAPNAMKAYKRKKLTFFPSSNNNCPQPGHTEMDLDSSDEQSDFPSVPPLPDEAPPALPPPPPPLPSDPPPLPACAPPPLENSPKSSKSSVTTDDKHIETINLIEEKNQDNDNVTEILTTSLEKKTEDSDEVEHLSGPDSSFITIDEDFDDETIANSSVRDSPSLDDLEEKKRQLLNALDGDNISLNSTDIVIDTVGEIEESIDTPVVNLDESEEKSVTSDSIQKANTSDVILSPCTPSTASNINSSSDTPKMLTGVKGTDYGTPVINIASPYLKLPSEDKFSKDICDVINFENLPNSTGKYKQITRMLKKVKSEVDRIQES